jgi:DNA-binding YbaB/EbfC family protein
MSDSEGRPGFDLDALMAQAQSMMGGLMKAQEEMAAREFLGRAGNGMVTVTMTGGGMATRVTIDPSIVDPTEVDLLEDLVLAAIRDATQQIGHAHNAGGVDLGGLGGLLGPGT